MESTHHARRLSAAQQGLWFAERSEPLGSANHLPITVTLDGDADPAALAAAFDTVVTANPILACAVRVRHERPEFVPANAPRLLTAAAGFDRDEFVQRPFDIESGPLIRAVLVREAATRHTLTAEASSAPPPAGWRT